MSNMSVVDVIKHYQRSIERCQDNQERMLHCISKLYRLPVTVQHLQDTGIGRTVNNLRKYEGDTGEAAKALVAKWKAMVAAEDSSEAEDQEEEQNHQESVEEEEEEEKSHKQTDHHKSNKHRSHNDRERSQRKDKSHHEKDRSHHDKEKSQHSREKSHDKDRSHYEKEKSHHKKQDVEKTKKSSSHEESKKRKYEEENGKKSERKKRKHESQSESSESEENCSAVEEDDSGHDSEAHSTSQTSQTVDDDSSDEEPVPQKHKYHSSTKERSKGHNSNKEHSSHKEHRSSKEHGHKDQSSHKKDKDKSKHKTENSERKDEKRKEDSSKKHKSSHIPEKKHSVKIKKEKADSEDGSIDCSTGASFAEALGMVDPIVKKKQHPSSPSTSSASHSNKSSSSSKKKDSSSKSSPAPFNLLAPNVKLEPLEVDLDATLPPITPNYKPLPHYNFLDSPPHRKVKQLTEEEALCQVMSTKNQRTKVYSGVKSGKSWATVPTLYDICVRVLQENIDALEYTGGVPFDILKPVLQHATPEQLFMLEHHNPYLINDTDELWKFHCQKQFRTKQRQDMETSREMYLRCLDEREAKLKALTSNIQQSIAKSTPVRQTKLAYVDSVAKPPRNVARQQAKYGTANKISKPSPAAKATAKVNAIAASASATATPVPPPRTIVSVTKQKPRMAPLMQKTMKLVKSFKR